MSQYVDELNDSNPFKQTPVNDARTDITVRLGTVLARAKNKKPRKFNPKLLFLHGGPART